MPFDTATVGSTEVDVALPVGATVGWTVLDDALPVGEEVSTIFIFPFFLFIPALSMPILFVSTKVGCRVVDDGVGEEVGAVPLTRSNKFIIVLSIPSVTTGVGWTVIDVTVGPEVGAERPEFEAMAL